MSVIDYVREMHSAGLYSNVRLMSSLLITFSDNNPELLSPGAHYQLLVYHADALHAEREFRKAEATYRQALQQKKFLGKCVRVRSGAGAAAPPPPQGLPSELEVKYKLADCYMNLRQDKDAIAVLDTVPAKQRTPKINMTLAGLYRKTGQERSAITCYKEVLRQCPLALEAILGLLSLSVKGAEVASLTVNTLQAMPLLEWLSMWIKAYAFAYARDYPRAITTFCSLDKRMLLKDNVDLLTSLARTYFRSGDRKNAITRFQQAQILDPYLIKSLDLYGYLLAKERRLEELEKLGVRLFGISDQQAEPWVVMGYYCYKTKKHTRAVYLAAKAIQLNGGCVQALLLKGSALRAMGKLHEAVLHFREAQRLAPNRLDCYEGLVECYLSLQRTRDALNLANAACKALGCTAPVLTMYACVWLHETSSTDKAHGLIDRALAQQPDLIKAVIMKAELLRRDQKCEEAMALVRAALTNRSVGILHRILGDFLAAINNTQEAMDQYSIALSLDRSDSRALEGMQRLEREEGGGGAEGVSGEDDGDDVEGISGEDGEGELEVSDTETAPWAEHEQWFGMQ
ncbi:LOW QUALITY PROTEIN: anaphase-promoting complex subunit 7 [Lethenteron reissneri]|uniref:LOW QUALITY PROTEIN: anaphase-promoting complex subunit 7 n=1 Tax=Lethenteron reissneri TaxID=7753 RepID=UPI002AB74DFB|nr:LOW QUALITY PROTEIN: anaphase-promoting complex subunit 7 [Lethenteron reissneri]